MKKYDERSRICLDCRKMQHDEWDHETGYCLVDGHRIDHINNYDWCEHFGNQSWRRTKVHNSDGYDAEASDAFNNMEYSGGGKRIPAFRDPPARPVRCVETGVVYTSAQQAVDSLGGSKCIYGCLSGKYKTYYGYHWEYADTKGDDKKQ